jgi:tetratricopeptide (TPR) repeat protein
VTAGLGLCATERYDDAIPLLEAACALAPWSAQARFHLGMSYHLQEAGERAPLNYRLALELRPDYLAVIQSLRSLLGIGALPGSYHR